MNLEPPGSPPPPYSCSGQNDSFSFRPTSICGVAYIPDPVMMSVTLCPSYPESTQHIDLDSTELSQTKQVSNNINQTTDPVPNEERIDWVCATISTAHELMQQALAAGKEGRDGSPYWVIRAHHEGDLVPGKFSVKNCSAYLPYGKKEVPVFNFEVLLAQPHAIRWVPCSHGQVPVGAIPAGNTQYGEPLYIARVKRRQYITPGKVHPSHGCCYISYHGSEQRYKKYEVLCKNVD